MASLARKLVALTSSSTSSREQTKTGFYTLTGQDGRDRRVDYVADANGFRATINTNEMGTAPKDSADGKYLSSSRSA